jgi:hypothetical protein
MQAHKVAPRNFLTPLAVEENFVRGDRTQESASGSSTIVGFRNLLCSKQPKSMLCYSIQDKAVSATTGSGEHSRHLNTATSMHDSLHQQTHADRQTVLQSVLCFQHTRDLKPQPYGYQTQCIGQNRHQRLH